MDVAIIGAGAAGLACAQQLLRAGHSVAILEASGRIGGCAFTQVAGAIRSGQRATQHFLVHRPRGVWAA